MDSTPTTSRASSTLPDTGRVNFPVLCCHGLHAKYGIVTKNGDNRGRRYYGCPNYPIPGHCSFFVWEEDLLRIATQQRDDGLVDSGASENREKEELIEKLRAKIKALKEEKRLHEKEAQDKATKLKMAYFAIFICVLYLLAH